MTSLLDSVPAPGGQPPTSPPLPGPYPRPVTTPQDATAGRDPHPDTGLGEGAGRGMSPRERMAAWVIGWAVAVLGVLGFANSFAAVYETARPSFGWLAWTVPLGIDVGIAVFTGLDIVLCRLDMRLRWLRLIPWGLVAATIYLNVANAVDLVGQVAHGVLPFLWVVAVEVAAHVIRTRARLASTTRMDRIRTSRWVLAPGRTAVLWRRMVLWEIRSYPDALRCERDRLLALTGLQDRYGPVVWRWRAPRRLRALYRLGELTPTHDTPPPHALAGPETAPADTATAAMPGAADTAAPPPADTVADPVDTPKRTRPPRQAGAPAGVGDRVARLRDRHPDMPQTEIARRLGVSDRTVRRHLATGNGAQPAPVATTDTDDDRKPGRG